MIEYSKFFVRKLKLVNKAHDYPLSLSLLASTADTCKQTQSLQRRTMTNQRRSAGNPSQPRTNEEQADRTDRRPEELKKEVSGLACSVLQIDAACWCLLFFFKENPFPFSPPSAWTQPDFCTFEILVVGGAVFIKSYIPLICFLKIAQGRKQSSHSPANSMVGTGFSSLNKRHKAAYYQKNN